jgi:hypothetical protein
VVSGGVLCLLQEEQDAWNDTRVMSSLADCLNTTPLLKEKNDIQASQIRTKLGVGN